MTLWGIELGYGVRCTAMPDVDPIVGYTDICREADGKVYGTAHRRSGASERTTVKITVDREIIRDGEVIAAGQVASSEDGTVCV